jgi:hypothetical protein
MPAFLLRLQVLLLLHLLLPLVVLVFLLILYSIDQGQDFFILKIPLLLILLLIASC